MKLSFIHTIFSNALTIRRDKSTLFSLMLIVALASSVFVSLNYSKPLSIFNYIQLFNVDFPLNKSLSFSVISATLLLSITSILFNIFEYAGYFVKINIQWLQIFMLAHNINFSLSYIFNIIKTSICIKLAMYILSRTISLFGIPFDVTLHLISLILLIFILIAFFTATNKHQIIFNVLILITFWSLGLFLKPFLGETFVFFFIFNYSVDSINITDLNIGDFDIPSNLKHLIDSVLKDLDMDLSPIGNGGPNNDGPDLTLIKLFMGHDDYDLPRIKQYYVDTPHKLSDKAINQMDCKNFIAEYNNLVSKQHNYSMTTLIKSNIIANDNLLSNRMVYSTPWEDNITSYNKMVIEYRHYLWENNILSKAKFFIDNRYDESAFLSKGHQLSCQSDYAYWLNRQVEYYNIFGIIQNLNKIIDITNDTNFYIELCNDIFWVKLHLLLFKSYLNYNIPFHEKVYNYNSIISYIFKLHCFQYEKAYICANHLEKLRISNYGSSMIDLVFKYTQPELSCWDSKYFSHKIGLGATHKFAFSEFKLKFSFNHDGYPSRVGLSTAHKFAFPAFKISSFYKK